MIFFLLWWLPLVLFGEGEPNFALATFGGEPEGMVAGCVNPMVGEYFIQADELVVNCARPIVLKRLTQSRGAIQDHGGWHFVPHLKITFNDDKSYIYGKEPSGASIEYVQQRKTKHFLGIRTKRLSHKYRAGESHLSRVTNSSQGVISGRNHIKNHRGTKRKGQFVVKTEEGITREYRKAKHEKHRKHYYLFREEFANGDYIQYFYRKDDRLERVESGHKDTGVIYGKVWFHDEGGNIRITTSDGQTLFCQGKKFHVREKKRSKRFLFHSFIYNDNAGGAETVEYSDEGKALPFAYQLSANHYQQIEYDGDPFDYASSRKVKHLSSPVGNTRDLQVTHTFIYHEVTDPLACGVTDLLTPNGHIKAFRYDRETGRPSEIEFYDGVSNKSNNMKMTYQWGEEGYLLKKELFAPIDKRVLSISLEYDKKGNVLRETLVTDKTLVTHYEYGAFSRMTKKIHPNGLVETFQYNGLDQLTLQQAFEGAALLKQVSYHYGTRNRLTEVISEEGGLKRIKKITLHTEAHCIDMPFIEEEFYEEGGALCLLSKKLIHYNDQLLVTRVDHFDGDDQCLFSIEREYDALRRLVMETDPLGRRRTLTYDEAGNLIAETKFGSPLTYTYTHDCMRRVITVTETAPDGTTRSLHTRYDLESNPIEKIDMRGHVTRTLFDGHGNPLVETSPEGAVTRRFFDHQKCPIKMIDPFGGETTATYNAEGQVTSMTYPNGATEKKTYTLTGQLKTHETLARTLIEFTYDIQDRPLTKITYNLDYKELEKETFLYEGPRLIEHTSPSRIIRYTYDRAGRKNSQTVNGVTTTYVYDASSRLSKEETGEKFKLLFYDLLGRVIREETNDEVSQFYYDRYDRLVSTSQTTPAGLSIKQREYDDYGRVTGQVDALGNRSSIAYKDIYHTPTTTLLEKTTINPRGTKRIETYTPQGKIASLKLIDWLGEQLLEELYTYDAVGNKIAQESHLPSHQVTTRWTYNSLGQLIQLDEAQNRTTRFLYDEAGRKTHIVKPGGVTLETTYDALSRPIRLTSSDGTLNYINTYTSRGQLETSSSPTSVLSNTYDAYGNLLSESYKGLTNHFTYDAFHRRREMVLPTGDSIYYDYDATHLSSVRFRDLEHTYHYESNRLIAENLPASLGQVTYTYNPLIPLSIESPYHMQKIHSLDEANNVTLLESDKQLSSYRYDALSQITHESGLFNHTYVIDAHYRRLQKDEDDHTYDELNQLLSRSKSLYTYTATGCRESANDTRYVYDALDRLIRIEKPSSTDIFTYDYFNRLISINGDALLYDGENEIGRFRNAEPLELRILGAPSRSSMLSATLLIQLGTETYIPLHDLYDNITHLLTLSGEVIHTSYFNPFGEERRTGLSANPWRYQSKRHFGSLVYFGERFYDINTALFLSPDPAGYSEGPNLYQYVHNNPLQLVDPSGAMIFYPESGGSGLYSSQGAWTGTMAQRGVTDLGPCWYNPTFEKRLGPAANNYGIKESFSFKLCSPDHQGPLREAMQKMGVDVYLKDPNRGPITLINGMGNVLIDNVNNAVHISKLLNHNVYSVYNATHGNRYDIMECCLGALGIATAPAIVLKEQWGKLFKEMPADQEILHYCHSQGAIHSKFALMLLPSELRSRINVVAIAPAIYIPNELCKSAINYAVRPDWRKDPEHQQITTLSFDPVPFLLNYVGKALALAPTMQKPELRSSYTYNVKFLDSHAEAPLVDHSFTSPTYIQSIREHGIAFINGDL